MHTQLRMYINRFIVQRCLTFSMKTWLLLRNVLFQYLELHEHNFEECLGKRNMQMFRFGNLVQRGEVTAFLYSRSQKIR